MRRFWPVTNIVVLRYGDGMALQQCRNREARPFRARKHRQPDGQNRRSPHILPLCPLKPSTAARAESQFGRPACAWLAGRDTIAAIRPSETARSISPASTPSRDGATSSNACSPTRLSTSRTMSKDRQQCQRAAARQGSQSPSEYPARACWAP
jgi:hypothetical protein